MLTNFLFTTKYDLQSINNKQQLASNKQTSNVHLVQQLICNLLYKLYENETKWPDLFIKAFIDDSLSERNWVDCDTCKEFIQNILLAFHTKIIPFSFESIS
jgi:integrator complex subunit 1